MKKNYIASLALVFCASLCFAQTQKQKTKSNDSKTPSKVSEIEHLSIKTDSTSSIRPKKIKAAPEVFYIVDDKAVDYKTYLLHLQKTKNQY